MAITRSAKARKPVFCGEEVAGMGGIANGASRASVTGEQVVPLAIP
jgi:hypothetical protein